MQNYKIIIFGSEGHIGKVTTKSIANKYDILTPTSSEVDLLNRKELINYAKKHKNSICVNLSYRHHKNDSPQQIYEYNINMINNIKEASQNFIKLIQIGSIVENTSNNADSFFVKLSLMDTIYRETKLYAYKNLSILDNCSYLKLAPCFGADFFIDKFIEQTIQNKKNINHVHIKAKIPSNYLYIYDFIKILEFFITSNNSLSCDLNNNDNATRNEIVEYIIKNKSTAYYSNTQKQNFSIIEETPFLPILLNNYKFKSIFTYIDNLLKDYSVSKHE